MVFSSSVFLLLFLPLMLAVYFAIPARWLRLRNAVLLLASLFFYSWGEGPLVLILILSILIDYTCGLLMVGTAGHSGEELPLLEAGGPRTARQIWALVASITSNLTILGFFKYFNFGVDNFNAMIGAVGLAEAQWKDAFAIALPLGISFFTFQSMSYSIDVFLGNTRATRNILDFACYVTMFPQLVAGPIVRYRDVAAQLVERHISLEDFAAGARRFTVGLGKKLLIANTVAVPADLIFGNAQDGIEGVALGDVTTGLAWLALICYTLQIYFDFSGYSDMAIGLGRMLGFRYLENFNYPYIAGSMTDFWRRWHISLSTWFRDYLYIPLGGNRAGALRTYFNLVTVFFLCGLWHGASWNFALWGLYHGVFLVGERLARAGGSRPPAGPPRRGIVARLLLPLRHAAVMLAVVLGWLLFRAESMPQTWVYFKSLFGFAPGEGVVHFTAMYLNTEVWLALIIGTVGSAPLVPMLARWRERLATGGTDGALRLDGALHAAANLAAFALLLLSLIQLSAGTHNPFIYFRF